jgi:hypothetical protein
MFHALAEESNALTSPFINQVRYEVEKLSSLIFLATYGTGRGQEYFQQEEYDCL